MSSQLFDSPFVSGDSFWGDLICAYLLDQILIVIIFSFVRDCCFPCLFYVSCQVSKIDPAALFKWWLHKQNTFCHFFSISCLDTDLLIRSNHGPSLFSRFVASFNVSLIYWWTHSRRQYNGLSKFYFSFNCVFLLK